MSARLQFPAEPESNWPVQHFCLPATLPVPSKTYKLPLKDCQALRRHSDAFTCVDMEGGTVDRLRNVVGRAPSAADVFALG